MKTKIILVKGSSRKIIKEFDILVVLDRSTRVVIEGIPYSIYYTEFGVEEKELRVYLKGE